MFLIVWTSAGVSCFGVVAGRITCRRTQCANNFKHIGVALHNYESAHSLFPPGQIYRHGKRIVWARFGFPARSNNRFCLAMLPPRMRRDRTSSVRCIANSLV